MDGVSKSLIQVEEQGETMNSTYDRNRILISIVCVALFALQGVSMSPAPEPLVDDEPTLFNGGAQPVRVVVSADSEILSADEVLLMSAQLYDNLNNPVSGEISWSCSNGTITDDGMFYPWSSGGVQIEASHNGLVGSINLTVTSGVGQTLHITSLSAHALLPVTLTADLLDARGNSQPATNVVWTIDGTYIGTGSTSWTPQDTGEYPIRARLYQMEHDATLVVSAGAPHEFVFDEGMQVRSGSALQMQPRLLDINGFEMNITTAGNRVWEVENGSIIPSGWFTATQPGLWAVNVSAGNITGSGTIRVVPADATLSQVTVLSEDDVFTAGTPYELAAMRTDSLGYTGVFTPALGNFSVSSGGLSASDGSVYWTPGPIGTHELRVDDDGVVSTLTVTVVHGPAIEASLELSSPKFTAGMQHSLTFMAYDVVGNHWVVNGSMTVKSGNSTQFTPGDGYATITPEEVRVWRVEGSWYDVSTDTRYEPVFQMSSSPGRLAFIHLDGDGVILPSDTPLNLNPVFFDAYSNQLEPIGLNWTVDGEDSTVDILLSDLHWIPTTVGGHEIRANADGVFATIRLTVVTGDARNLATNFDDGLTVRAGIPSELFIQTIDAHGNLAPSTAVFTSLDADIGTLVASSSGNGYWDFNGKTQGSYTLELIQDNATHSIPLSIEPGIPVRIISSVQVEDISQGDTVLLKVQSVDIYDNFVIVDPENTTVSCTSGSAKYVTSDTWELDISSSGNDRSCNVLWNGLLSQNFFDVESVLLGGAVGSTNTAMGLGIFLLSLVLVTLVVLVRKANAEELDEIENSLFDEDDLEEEVNGFESEEEPFGVQKLVPPIISDEERASLAAQAAAVGVMQAASNTQQGSSGWYVDVNSEAQYWNVSDDGAWTRVE